MTDYLIDIIALVAYARERGAGEGALDEAVHEVFSARASAVNNGGLAEQVGLLLDEYPPEVVRQIIESEGADPIDLQDEARGDLTPGSDK